MNSEINDDLQAQIEELSGRGNELAAAGAYKDALLHYQQALSLLPEPLTQCPTATWVLTAIGETFLFDDNYEDARHALQDAMHCPGAIGNPLIHLRLGQAQYELGNMPRAKDELVRAYMGAGHDIFDDEDPKYLALVHDCIRL